MKILFIVFTLFGASSSFGLVPVADDLQQRALLYFVEQSHPVTGLVLDRAANFGDGSHEPGNRMASLAATGFGIAVFANASTRGLMEPEDAQKRIERALHFVSSRLEHHHGWIYHFVDWETGVRYGNSEISTIDTTWFVAGALYASAVFPDTEISRLARTLYHRLDFNDMLTDGGRYPRKTTISQGWMPESGYLHAQWNRYSEQVLLLILGLGSPTSPLPNVAWVEGNRPLTKTANIAPIIGADLPLFVHQYSHLFLDHSGLGAPDYFDNSKRATIYNRSFCAEQSRFATFRAGFWGLSAGDSKTGYLAFSPVFFDGTVCPACAGASAVFAPELVLDDLEDWIGGPYSSIIFGRYGFIDSFNIDQDWFDQEVIGITVGALYLSIADLDPKTSLWPAFNSISEVRNGARRAKAISAELGQR